MSVIDPAELSRRLAHHPPRTDVVVDLHADVRRQCLALAEWLNENLPGGPEAEEALDAVDRACMYANAAVARRISGTRGRRAASDPGADRLGQSLTGDPIITVGDPAGVVQRIIDDYRALTGWRADTVRESAGRSARAAAKRQALGLGLHPGEQAAANDPELLEQLRDMGSRWGPLGVALAAAHLTDADTLCHRLQADPAGGPQPAPEEP